MSRFFVAVAFLVALSIGGCVVFDWLIPTHARQMLPKNATEVRDREIGPSGFTGDVYYQLKAKITEDDFFEYVSRLKLIPIAKDQDAKFGGHSGTESWWDASSGNEGCYVRIHNESRLERAKHENGYVYYIDSIGYSAPRDILDFVSSVR